MSISLGIFDVFTSAVPGSLYVAIVLYLSNRFDWLDVRKLGEIDSTVVLVAFVLVAYVAGQVLGPFARQLTDKIPGWQLTEDDDRAEFAQRNPTLANRSYVHHDVFTLLAGVRCHAEPLAVEIDRSRAYGLMLRNIAAGILVVAVIGAGETIAGHPVGLAVALGGGAAALLALRQGRRFRSWAVLATLEAAAWIPELT